MSNKQQGHRYENDWTKEELEDILKIVDIGITLPVNTEIKADQTVLNLDEAKQYLTKASKIALRDCTCRTARKHCSHSLDTCFALNGLAEFNIKNGISKEISLREAIGILERAHDEGLIHMAYVLIKARARIGRSTQFAVAAPAAVTCSQLHSGSDWHLTS